MVPYPTILSSNRSITSTTFPRVAVFVGGTSGIGQLTIRALVSTGHEIKIYLIGRKASFLRAEPFISALGLLNPRAHILWTEAEVSLLSDCKRVCDEIKTQESRLDLLFLSAGYAPLGSRTETSEGVEITQALEFYSRILFTLSLLPLLQRSEIGGRVISVLGGGLERGRMEVDDIELKHHSHGLLGLMKSRGQTIALNTVFLDRLAVENTDITFLHSWPGSVNTGNVRRGDGVGWVVMLLRWVVLEPMIYLFSTSDEEAAQRYLFQCTSGMFGGRGVRWEGEAASSTRGPGRSEGLFLVSRTCEATPNQANVALLREVAGERVWEYTMEKLRPYL